MPFAPFDSVRNGCGRHHRKVCGRASPLFPVTWVRLCFGVCGIRNISPSESHSQRTCNVFGFLSAACCAASGRICRLFWPGVRSLSSFVAFMSNVVRIWRSRRWGRLHTYVYGERCVSHLIALMSSFWSKISHLAALDPVLLPLFC